MAFFLGTRDCCGNSIRQQNELANDVQSHLFIYRSMLLLVSSQAHNNVNTECFRENFLPSNCRAHCHIRSLTADAVMIAEPN